MCGVHGMCVCVFQPVDEGRDYKEKMASLCGVAIEMKWQIHTMLGIDPCRNGRTVIFLIQEFAYFYIKLTQARVVSEG